MASDVKTQALVDSLLALPPAERALIAETVLESLDRPDPAVDAAWAIEIEERIAAHDAGEMKSIPAAEVMAEFGDP